MLHALNLIVLFASFDIEIFMLCVSNAIWVCWFLTAATKLWLLNVVNNT